MVLFIMPIIFLGLLIVLTGLLIWFGFKISDGLIALTTFFQNYWIWILVAIIVIAFYPQIRAILNAILRKIGIKV